jgi:hypothetical protein
VIASCVVPSLSSSEWVSFERHDTGPYEAYPVNSSVTAPVKVKAFGKSNRGFDLWLETRQRSIILDHG